MADVHVEVAILLGLDAHPNSLYAREQVPDEQRQPIFVASERITAIFVRAPNRAPPEYKVQIEQPLAGVRSDEREIFDPERCTYVLGPIPQAHLDALLAAGTVEVQLTWSYHEVFDLILQDWLSSNANATLASRRDDDPILATIIAAKHLGSKKARVPFELHEKRARVSVAARVSDHAREAKGTKLVLALEPASADERVILARMLVAADWSVLAGHALTPPVDSTTLTGALRLAVLNVQRLLAWRLDTERGRAIQQGIVGRNVGRTDAKQLVVETRRDIDQFLIAANHWGEAREASDSQDPIERYQSRMSDFFGMLYEKHTLASPVNLVRGLFDPNAFGINIFPFDVHDSTIWLQLGVGHCGEHARTAYAILAMMRDLGADKVIRQIISSGNVNIDHAFVIVNVAVNECFVTRVLNEASFRALGTKVTVIDLRNALAGMTADGLVLDAYLQLDRFDASATALLDSLGNKKNSALVTNYVMTYASAPKIPKIEEVWERDDATLRKEFKNL